MIKRDLVYQGDARKPLKKGMNRLIGSLQCWHGDGSICRWPAADRYFSANRMDIRSVFVKPIVENDNIYTRINRWFERKIVRHFKKDPKMGWWIKWVKNQSIVSVGGAEIQSENLHQRGYTPQSVIKKGIENNALYCQRCFKLRHYNQLEKVLKRLRRNYGDSGIADTHALVVNVIDIFDIAGSIIPGIQRIIGNNDLLLVANKVDLLPKEINRNRLKKPHSKNLEWSGHSCLWRAIYRCC